MGEYFDQDRVFPIIRGVIWQTHNKTSRFVTHDEIAEGLLQDIEGSSEVENAFQRSGRHSRRWWASNMVAWFSQRITSAYSTDDRYRVLLDRGRVMLAIEKYRGGAASLEKAARLAGVSLSKMMDVLAEHGVQANLEQEDYLKNLKTARKIW